MKRTASFAAVVCCFLVLPCGTSIAQRKNLQSFESPVISVPTSRATLHAMQFEGALAKPAVLKCHPAPCALPNEQASTGGNAVIDSMLSVNPTNALQLLSGATDFNCATLQGLYASSDGGATWTRNCLAPAQSFAGAGNPILGYDRSGIAYAAGIEVRGRPFTTMIAVGKSTNNGAVWTTPTEAVSSLFNGGITDTPWLQVDTNAKSPHVNALYISLSQHDSSGVQSEITVSHSSDGGVTWATSPVDSVQSYPEVDQFTDLAIAKDGTVYVSWMRCLASAGNCGGSTADMMISKSADGGNSWSVPVVMATINLVPDTCNCGFYGSLPNVLQPVSDLPAIGIDTSKGVHSGTLYASMYHWTGQQMQVEVTRSTDGGTTWSTPLAVAAGSQHDEFFPWLSVSSNGMVAVTWLDRRNDPSNIQYQTYAAISKDGGASFGANIAVASGLSNPNEVGFCGGTGTCFMGDYAGNIWAGKKLYASWMDTRTGAMQDEIGGVMP